MCGESFRTLGVGPSSPPARKLEGMYCHPVPDSNLLEIGARDNCAECGRPGFFNIQRIQKPKNFSTTLELGLLNVDIHVGPLEPVLSPAGKPNEHICPTCKLRWLDPVKFTQGE